MAPSESYQHVVKGGLKLKGGGGLPTAGGVKKKKKKKDKEVRTCPSPLPRRHNHPTRKIHPVAHPSSPPSTDAQREREAPLELAAGENEGDEASGSKPKPKDNRTEAEKRYDEQAERTQARLIEKMASKSHKDKVRDFNEYLSKLSEHHDIPKVGPG
jgi:hypothetical protein